MCNYFLSLINQLDQLDKVVTLAINHFNNTYFDSFFFIYTQTWVWIPVAFVLVYLLWRQWSWQSLYFLIAIAIVILISDQISSSIIKPLVSRPRPSHNLEISDVVHTVNGYRGGAFGFVSSHAANAVGFVVFTALLFKRKAYTILFSIWAFLTAYSRVYLGVHYVGDILCGSIIGVLSALLVYFILYKVYIRKRDNYIILSEFSNKVIFFVLNSTIGIIALYSGIVSFF